MALVSYSVFTVEDIMNICGIDRRLANVVYAKVNGKYFDYADAVKDRKRANTEAELYKADAEEIGMTLGDQLAWETAVEREHIPEKVKECHRKLKTWRRKQKREGLNGKH